MSVMIFLAGCGVGALVLIAITLDHCATRLDDIYHAISKTSDGSQ